MPTPRSGQAVKPQQVAAATPRGAQGRLVRRVIVDAHRRAPAAPRRRGVPAPAAAPPQKRQLGVRTVSARACVPPARSGPGGARPAPDVHAVLMSDLTFDCMGSHARIVCADDATAASCRAFLERFDAALSRFRPDSELCRLNAAQLPEVIVSPLLRVAVASGLVAAELTGGLVDPTLVPALENAGYDRSRREPELAAGRRACGRAAASRRGGRPRGALAEGDASGAGRVSPPARRPARHRRHGQGPRRRPPPAQSPRRPLGRRLRW